MKSKILAAISFCFLFLFVAGWIAYSIKTPLFFGISDTKKKNSPQIQEKQEWVGLMSDHKSNAYIYPTNEMVLKYDFDRGVEPLRIFIKDLSEYRFFCINQILIESKIEYAYYKTNEVIQLVVFLNDKKMQDKILEDFDYYQIQYSLYSSSH
ncbi:hypothetical protein [Helicobacter kayseriensis]|uniref:hypothetical protein n=1 Tax=Helicobacter kayseriensis TaxID=2905877 RepID=UPI001E5D8B28|nr:hypothetical protein [Helicobacter kayseriensis]MCE3047719.1 hypothetical protein [Helicobacter kayseriensis]